MRYKVSFLAGFSAGFVVGAKAGRERYEQLMKLARRTADNPAVQQAAAAMQAKAAGLASTATHKVAGQFHDGSASAREKVPGMRDRESNGHDGGKHHFASASDTPPLLGMMRSTTCTPYGLRPVSFPSDEPPPIRLWI